MGIVVGRVKTAMPGVSGGILACFLMPVATLSGCDLPQDTRSLFLTGFQRSEIFGFLAGFGTTFAAVPDLIAMLRRRTSAGMNHRLVTIMIVFQTFWIYYGLLIVSRPIVAWNTVAVLVNIVTICAYRHYASKEKRQLPR